MKDRLKHILVGAVISFAVAVPVYASSCDLFAGLWACLAGLIAGGVKEWCDMRENKWSWTDFGFTAIGVGIVMLFVLCMHFGKG